MISFTWDDFQHLSKHIYFSTLVVFCFFLYLEYIPCVLFICDFLSEINLHNMSKQIVSDIT